MGSVGVVIRLELPGELRYRHVALRAVSAACKAVLSEQCGPDAAAEPLVNQVVSAVGEAFNNVVLHGYRNGPAGPVRLRMESGTGFIRLIIEDTGASWDPLEVEVPDLAALPEAGLGVFIMRSFMDEVAYRPGRPNVLTLTKRFFVCPADSRRG